MTTHKDISECQKLETLYRRVIDLLINGEKNIFVLITAADQRVIDSNLVIGKVYNELRVLNSSSMRAILERRNTSFFGINF